MAHIVSVNLGSRSYEIYIAWGALHEAASLLESRGLRTRLFIITHPQLRDMYGSTLERNLADAGFDVTTATVPAGEESKSLAVAATLYDQMVDARLSRDAAVVALGGGVVGDLAGFVAATYMRGIRFVQIPTTLLAQVDASVGGKVAINHPRGKNLIGAFHQPSFVLIDPATLATLPEREIRSGLAEVVKYGVIHDDAFFRYLEANAEGLVALERTALEEAIRRSCEIKAWVVERDERESDLRAILNFGHTFGHGIEAASGYSSLLHGECVALGMLAAAQLASDTGLCPPDVRERLLQITEQVGLPTRASGVAMDAVLQAMELDKKGRAGKLRFILPERIGSVRIVDNVDRSTIVRALESVMC